MWIWKDEYDRFWREFRHHEVTVAKLEAQNEMLRQSNTLFKDQLEKLQTRNESLFDMLMQIKHQHPGTGYQDAMKQMYVDSEALLEEDPEQLRKYHAKMQDLVDAGLDPGMILLEDIEDDIDAR